MEPVLQSLGTTADLPPVLGGVTASLMSLPEDMAHEIGGCESDATSANREVEALEEYWANLVAKHS